MKRNLNLIAERNASEAIKAYNQEIQSKDWMTEVDENEIYESINSPEFRAYMAILGLDDPENDLQAA